MVTLQGQQFCPDTSLIERLLGENPGWGRTRLSVKLCELWDWRASNGQLKDMACRNLLLRLEQAGQIRLPPRQRKSTNADRNRSPLWVPHPTALSRLTVYESWRHEQHMSSTFEELDVWKNLVG